MNIQHQNQDIIEFNECINKWLEVYEWSEISYFALKEKGKTYLLHGRLLFDTSKKANNFEFETENIIAGRCVSKLKPGDLEKLTSNATSGKLYVANTNLLLPTQENGMYSNHLNPYFQPVSGTPRATLLTIHGEQRFKVLTGANKNDLLLDWEVRGADKPFSETNELLAFIGFPGFLQMGHSTSLELFARWPILISDKSRVKNNKAFIYCSAAKNVDVNAIKLGYRIPQKNDSGYFLGDKLKWHVDGDYQKGEISFDVDDLSVIHAFISYRAEAIHSWWVYDPENSLNVRKELHDVFDHDSKVLRESVLDQTEPDKFEQGIAMLFHLSGFSVYHYGLNKKLRDGPDIIAISPNGNICVIECTTDLLDKKDKLAKLIKRSRLVIDKMSNSGHAHLLIQPIIVSALARDKVKVHVEEANNNKIAILCREELKEMTNEAALRPNADQLFQDIIETIAEVSQGDMGTDTISH